MNCTITQSFIDSWNAPFVARGQVAAFSGGLVSSKTLANADSSGTGPSERLRFGKRKVAYPKRALAEWLANHFSDFEGGV